MHSSACLAVLTVSAALPQKQGVHRVGSYVPTHLAWLWITSLSFDKLMMNSSSNIWSDLLTEVHSEQVLCHKTITRALITGEGPALGLRLVAAAVT